MRASYDPFNPDHVRQRTRDERDAKAKHINAAMDSIRAEDIGRIKALLNRFPPSDYGRHYIEDAAHDICFKFALGDQGDHERTGVRKPGAMVVTDAAAYWYWLLTEKTATRITKKVQGKHGDFHEAGPFASFLDDVFAVFGIKASGAAQAKMWKQRAAADPTVDIHPHEMVNYLSSIEGVEQLLAKVDSYKFRRRS